MLIAGDIGGTKTRLALVSPEAGPRKFVAEQEFHSPDYEGLQPVVEAFLAKTGGQATSACFDVAGPVIDGRTRLTNLAWDLDEAKLSKDLGLARVTLLNDLNAIAHAIPHLKPEELVDINPGKAKPQGAIAVVAPGTGLGEAFLIWSGTLGWARPAISVFPFCWSGQAWMPGTSPGMTRASAQIARARRQIATRSE